MVVTGAPRKRLVRKGTWVRIPPSAAILRQTLASLAGYGWQASVHRAPREGCPPKPASGASVLAKEDKLSTAPSRFQFLRSLLDRTARFSLSAAIRRVACSLADVSYPAKRFVYIIRSVNHPERRYIGVSADVAARVNAHNAGQNQSTASWRPWFVEVVIEFRTEPMAARFESP